MALVTGGALRLGRAICLRLSENAVAVPVVIHCNSSQAEAYELKELIESSREGARAEVVVCDLKDSAATESLVEKASLALGGVAINTLVNSASIFIHDDLESLGEGQRNLFAEHMQVNLLAPALLCKAFQSHVKARAAAGEVAPRGTLSIINILDQKLANTNPDHLSYTLSKYGLAGLTDTLARSLAADGIRCNAVSPGFVLPNEVDGMGEAELLAAQAGAPLGYGPSPSDVAAAVGFLASATTARTITGQTLYVDCGERFNARQRDVALVP